MRPAAAPPCQRRGPERQRCARLPGHLRLLLIKRRAMQPLAASAGSTDGSSAAAVETPPEPVRTPLSALTVEKLVSSAQNLNRRRSKTQTQADACPASQGRRSMQNKQAVAGCSFGPGPDGSACTYNVQHTDLRISGSGQATPVRDATNKRAPLHATLGDGRSR